MHGTCSQDEALPVSPAPNKASKREMQAGQCQLKADQSLFWLVDDELWIDNLYVVFHRTERSFNHFEPFIPAHGSNAEVRGLLTKLFVRAYI